MFCSTGGITGRASQNQVVKPIPVPGYSRSPDAFVDMTAVACPLSIRRPVPMIITIAGNIYPRRLRPTWRNIIVFRTAAKND